MSFAKSWENFFINLADKFDRAGRSVRDIGLKVSEHDMDGNRLMKVYHHIYGPELGVLTFLYGKELDPVYPESYAGLSMSKADVENYIEELRTALENQPPHLFPRMAFNLPQETLDKLPEEKIRAYERVIARRREDPYKILQQGISPWAFE